MIDTIHEAFMEELKKIAAVGVYTPGSVKPPRVPKPKGLPRIVKAPRVSKPKLQEPTSVPGQATVQTLNS